MRKQDNKSENKQTFYFSQFLFCIPSILNSTMEYNDNTNPISTKIYMLYTTQNKNSIHPKKTKQYSCYPHHPIKIEKQTKKQKIPNQIKAQNKILKLEY